MDTRATEDRLRREYALLLPQLRRVAEEVEVQIRHCVLPLSHSLDQHERIEIKSRIKDCESALKKLRKKEGRAFDDKLSTLTKLKDLVGVRVLVFPRTRIQNIHKRLRKRFPKWVSDPEFAAKFGKDRARKYYGHCRVSKKIIAEYQIVPMLMGLFWDVEHAAIYKPAPSLKGADRNPDIRKRKDEVYCAFRAFEDELEAAIKAQTKGRR